MLSSVGVAASSFVGGIEVFLLKVLCYPTDPNTKTKKVGTGVFL